MKELKEVIRKLEVFQGLKEETYDLLVKYGEFKKYSAKELLFVDKEKVNIIYVVVSGTVSLFKSNENGQKKIVFILDKGKMINEVIIQDLPASISCEVFEESYIFGIHKEKLLRVMKGDFELCKNVMISLSKKTRRMYRQLKNTTPSVKIEKKLAAKLYKLGKDYGIDYDDGILININMTVTYIADLLGSQRETVSRALKVLQKEGLIIYKDKKIFIFDLQELSDFFKKS